MGAAARPITFATTQASVGLMNSLRAGNEIAALTKVVWPKSERLSLEYLSMQYSLCWSGGWLREHVMPK
jgi:hypothetical protein